MMIFTQNQQIVPMRKGSYGAKQFVWFWTKRAFFAQNLY